MDFFMPTRLYTGDNCVAEHGAELRELGASCIIVTGANSAKASGALDDVLAALEAAGIASVVWDGVNENPPVADCIEAARAAIYAGVEFVLGIGGGSALDATKAVAVFAANPGLEEDAFYAKEWANEPLPIALVGTTSGTGSEVTKVSVLTDSRARKHSIHDDRLYARLAFGDARYTKSCPRYVSLTCGVDILAHAIESYFSRKADEISRAFAVRAVRLAMEPLAAIEEGLEITDDQYTQLYDASILAGLAINTTGTCFPHNVGYYLTETYDIPHGFACAIFLPELFERVSDHDPAYADAFFVACGTSEVALTRLIKSCLPKYGIHMSADEIEAALPRWENNGSVKNTRANVDAATIREMLLSMFA